VRPCTSASRRATRAAFAHFTELCREFGVVDPHQNLPLLHDRAFLDQDFQDDTAFQTLHDLDLARRHDPAVAALDLVEHGKMRPDDPRDHQRNDRRQENPRCDRCGKL
jgi:hypothetical protein